MSDSGTGSGGARGGTGPGGATKECPLCGETMRVKSREMIDRIPGQSQVVRREVREWTCPECDFYEEVESDRAPV